MAPAPGPNDLTRQQLDELDVLLQRMLGLPLDPPAPPPVPQPLPAPPLPDLPPGWRLDGGHLKRPDPHADAPLTPAFVSLAATSAVGAVAEAPRRSPVVAVEHDHDDEPVIRFGPPTTDTGSPTGPYPRTLRGADAPALPSGFQPSVYVEPDPTPEPAAVELRPVPQPAAREPGLPVALYPLFAVNWLLETACGLAGPVGAAAVRPAGKHMLGVLGLALLAAAAAWTARGYGFVDFPVPARPAWWK